MKKVPHVKEKVGSLFTFLLIFSLLGCETTKQNNTYVAAQGYTQLDSTNPKDKEFYEALDRSLKKQGSLLSVCADTQELNLYREGKRPYPTNYRYTLKANPRVSLEEIKHANLITNRG
jgi:hypothetical protein